MENRNYFEPHVFKEKYKALAYITSAPNGTPLLNRIYRAKRLDDKGIIEKGKIVIYKNERYRVLRFIDLGSDLGVECNLLTNKKSIQEIPCSDLIIEQTEC